MARKPSLITVNGVATRATSLYDQLRIDILSGQLEPGSKLTIDTLTERYSTSATPVREALNRLISDNLVEKRELRGFVVAGISAQDLEEITKTRCWLEERALRESIAARSTVWEEELVLAHHRLSKTPRSLADDHFEDNPDWEPLHRAFHRTLISGCGSRWLVSFCELLADQHHRYRTLSAPRAFSTKRDVKSEHTLLMEEAIAGNADRAVELLCAHIRRTADIIKGDPELFSEHEQAESE